MQPDDTKYKQNPVVGYSLFFISLRGGSHKIDNQYCGNKDGQYNNDGIFQFFYSLIILCIMLTIFVFETGYKYMAGHHRKASYKYVGYGPTVQNHSPKNLISSDDYNF